MKIEAKNQSHENISKAAKKNDQQAEEMNSKLSSQKINKPFEYEVVADPGGLFSKSPDLLINSISNLT